MNKMKTSHRLVIFIKAEVLFCKSLKETSTACGMLPPTGYLSRTLYIQYWFSTHFALALNPSNESCDHHCAVSSPFLLNFLPRINKLNQKPSIYKKASLKMRSRRNEINPDLQTRWNTHNISTEAVHHCCARHFVQIWLPCCTIQRLLSSWNRWSTFSRALQLQSNCAVRRLASMYSRVDLFKC